MAIQQKKVRFLGSLVEETRVSLDKDNMEPGDLVELFTMWLTAATPKPRYDNWKELADQINENLKNNNKIPRDRKQLCKEELNEVKELLEKASKMLDAGGSVGPINDIRVFNAILKEVEAKIEILSHEIYAYPMAEYGNKTMKERSDGGKKKKEEGEEERKERNEKLQEHINRLCFERGFTYSAACKHLEGNPSLYKIDGQLEKKLSRYTIRDNTKNPNPVKS